MVDRKLDNFLDKMLKSGGSDLHLKTGAAPRIRVNGEIKILEEDILGIHFFQDCIDTILNNKQIKDLETNKELDGYYITSSEERYRFNIFYHLKGYGFVFRTIPSNILSIEELNLPKVINDFAEFKRGLVLVTGTTGSGKSTTLAAIIDAINRKQKKHIITIEDPIEFVHSDKNCIIEQRNVGEHTLSFSNALKSALREDPDIILVGELRDTQTVEIALHAANSGHLVLSTLHTLDAKETIDRIIGVFPPNEQNRIRMTLASVIQGIVSQRLIKNIDGSRSAATEVLVNTDRIKAMIIEKRDYEINDAIEEGSVYGMQSFDQALYKLYKSGLASVDEVLQASSKPEDLRLKISNDENSDDETEEIIGFKSIPKSKEEKEKKREKLTVLKLKR